MKLNIIVVGCGGTGSSLIPWIARYCVNRKDVSAVLHIIDGDAVEFKNLTRQIFIDEDAGRNKALVFADALTESFGIDARGYDYYIQSGQDIKALFDDSSTNILIGCVDNAVCRAEMKKCFYTSSDLVYIDTGNDYIDGQCVIGMRADSVTVSPSYDYYFGEENLAGQKARADMSCSELNASTPQHFAVNIMSANVAFAAFVAVAEGRPESARGLVRFDVSKMSMTHEMPERYGFSVSAEVKCYLAGLPQRERCKLAEKGKFLDVLVKDSDSDVRLSVCTGFERLANAWGEQLEQRFLRDYDKIVGYTTTLTSDNDRSVSKAAKKVLKCIQKRREGIFEKEGGV